MKPILIAQNCPAETAGTIIEYLNIRDLPYRIVHTYKNEALSDLDEVEAVINLGCPISVADYHEHEYLKTLYGMVCEVVRLDKPYLGICFGGQILARALGAKVGPNKVREIGTYRVSLTDAALDDPLFANFARDFPVFHWHADTFQVPFGAQHLAEGADCRNQAFRKGNAVALQFHLEVDPKEVPLWCDLYHAELTEIGLSKEEVAGAYERIAPAVKELNFRMLDNFFKR